MLDAVRIWFDLVTRRDARLLSNWWNGHTDGTYEVRRSPSNGKYWAVYRTA